MTSLKDITERPIAAKQALDEGIFDPPAPSWFSQWAQEAYPNVVVYIYIYSFGGIVVGFVYGEHATLDTLKDFQETSDQVSDEIWVGLKSEMEGWLDERSLQAGPSAQDEPEPEPVDIRFSSLSAVLDQMTALSSDILDCAERTSRITGELLADLQRTTGGKL